MAALLLRLVLVLPRVPGRDLALALLPGRPLFSPPGVDPRFLFASAGVTVTTA